MSVTVNFYNFTKDDNSTAQPTASQLSAALTCDFLEPFNILSPRIIVSAAKPATSGVFWNYCQISDFERFYFVSNWTYNNGLWYADLRVDVLATYKAAIGSTSLYILRSSAARNGYIKDTYYPLTGQTSASGEIIDVDDIGLGSGAYIVNIIGNNTGSSTLYKFTPYAFSAFISALLAQISTDVGPITDVAQAVHNAMFKPIDYIKSILWVPDGSAFGGVNVSSVYVGKWEASGISATRISTASTLVRSRTITIPKHPQASRGKYLNMGPYTEYWLDYDPFGLIPLDASKMVDESTLTLNIYADAITGIAILKIGGSNSGTLASVSAQWGVPVPFSGAAANLGAVASAAQSIGGFIGGMITGNAGLIAGAALAGIADAGDAIRGNISTMGSAGSLAAYQTGKTFGAIFHHVTDADNAHNGSPLMVTTTPSALTGFMIAQRGDVAISGTTEEADKIRAILERGFYYE